MFHLSPSELQPTLPRGPGCLCSGIPGPKLRAPAGPRNGKQMALLTAAGCSQQSRRGNFSFAVIHHRAGNGRRRGGEERQSEPDTRRLASFKRLRIGTFMARTRTHM